MSNNLVIKNDSFIQSVHNTIDCISLVDAKRPNDRCWFTSKQIQDWAGMDRKTLDRRLEKLISVGRITNNAENIENTGNSMIVKFDNHQSNSRMFTDIMSITLYGANNIPHETKIYNLNVLNHLAMVELDNEKLNTIANKFSDILSEVETTGQYNVQKQVPSYMIEDPIEQAKAWIREQEEKRALEAEKKALEDQNRALEAENKDLHDTNDEILNENEIIRGKYHNTKQIYDIIMQEYPEALRQAKTTNYNKLRKALKELSNKDKESIKVYKKHVTNRKGEQELRQEYYFVHDILLKVLDCIHDNIKYIANIRLKK